MIGSRRCSAARPSALAIHLPFGTVRRLQSAVRVRPSVSGAREESTPSDTTSINFDRRGVVGAWLAAISLSTQTAAAWAEPKGAADRIFFDVKLEGVPAGE